MADTVQNAGKDQSSQIAGQVVAGDGSSNLRRYASKATAGAVDGASKGGAHGAAIGAAKDVGLEAARDAAKGVDKVTGGSPVATPADEKAAAGAGGTGPAASTVGAADSRGHAADGGAGDDSLLGAARKGAVVGGAAAMTPSAMAVVMLMALFHWLKSFFFATLAQVLGALTMVLAFLVKAGKLALAPVMGIGGTIAKTAAVVAGFGTAVTIAPVAALFSGLAFSVSIFALLGALIAGIVNFTAITDGKLPGVTTAMCLIRAAQGHGTGTFTGAGVPAEAVPWVENAAAHSDAKIPAAFFAYIMDRETDFRPGLFAMDSNGGTWGLFQMNYYEWNKITDGGSFESPDIKDPMIHTAYGAKYFDARLATVRTMRANNPTAAYTTELTDLEALMIAHNAGEGNLQKYPNIPSITKSYLSEFREKFPLYGGGEPGETPAEGEGVVGSLVSGVRTTLASCLAAEAGGVGILGELRDGGLSMEEAEALVSLYNAEADAFLMAKYNGLGPGRCNGSYVRNCVSFSVYFLNKYTNFAGYPSGNGINTANSVAQQTGKPLSSTPTPYSVGSGPASTAAGHTLIVLAVSGDQVLVGEAGWCAYAGRVRIDSAANLAASGWKFVDMADVMLETPKTV